MPSSKVEFKMGRIQEGTRHTDVRHKPPEEAVSDHTSFEIVKVDELFL